MKIILQPEIMHVKICNNNTEQHMNVGIEKTS
jgi:hypothetical protein